MKKEISVQIKTVYGEEKYCPQCLASSYFAKIARTKTLSRHALAWIESLGYEIKFYVDVNGTPMEINKEKAL